MKVEWLRVGILVKGHSNDADAGINFCSMKEEMKKMSLWDMNGSLDQWIHDGEKRKKGI